MAMNNNPELDPMVFSDPQSAKPALAASSDGTPNGWQISASKKVDDISKHESKHDIKHDPKQDPKHGITPKPEDQKTPGAPLPPGGKPTPGKVKR